MEQNNELMVRQESGLTTSMVAPGEIMRVIDHVHDVIRGAMKEGIDNDYGVIPGTIKKSLLKPGAEKLLMAFGLTALARTPVIADLPNGHREVTIETEIISMRSGICHAVGVGSCSTMEGKYRFRKADLVCPECGVAAIIKGKAEFGGGWICYEKKGGCKKKWTDAENPFSGVSIDKAEHDNPADYYNTVLKIASKRSMVDGTIRATASSAMFTQDAEDIPGLVHEAGKTAPAGTTGKPPIEQPKKKTTSATPPADGETIAGTIEKVEEKSGEKNGKPWVKFGIYIGGKAYGTFDKKIGEAAQILDGQNAKITFKKDGNYLTCTGIMPVEAPAPLTGDPEGCTKFPGSCQWSIYTEGEPFQCGEHGPLCKYPVSEK